MNTDNADSAERRKADALDALAARETQASGGPADPFSQLEEAANAEPELIPDDEPDGEGAQDFLKEMATESNQVSPELSRLRAMVGGEVAVADNLVQGVDPNLAAAAPAPSFTTQSRRSATLQANARKMQKTAFKQFMIPLLLVVGGLLILMSVVTMVMLGAGGNDAPLRRSHGPGKVRQVLHLRLPAHWRHSHHGRLAVLPGYPQVREEIREEPSRSLPSRPVGKGGRVEKKKQKETAWNTEYTDHGIPQIAVFLSSSSVEFRNLRNPLLEPFFLPLVVSAPAPRVKPCRLSEQTMQTEHANQPRALNWPNRISLVRLLLVGPFVVLLINQHAWPWARHAALAIFLVMAVSDFVDGLLARRLGAITRLGAILDPLADKVLVISAVVLLSIHRIGAGGYHLPNWLPIAVVGKDLWVIVGTVVIYLVTDRLRVRPTIAGKASTVGQLLLVGYTLAAADIARLSQPTAEYGVLAGSWGVAGLSVLAIISYTRLGLTFVSAEGKPLENPVDHDHQGK